MLNRLGNLLPAFGWLGGADRTEPGSGKAVRGRRSPASRALSRSALENTSVQRFDAALVWMTALLLGLGLVMVYSASIAILERRDPTGGSATFYLVRQSAAIGMALVASVFAYAVPPERWQQLARPLFAVGAVLLILVFVPVIGKRAGGAVRWVTLGFTTIQPTELMKLFVILYAADYSVRKQQIMGQWRAFVPMAIALSVVGLLIMRQSSS